MGGRGKDASDGSTVTAMRVRVQDDFRHPGSLPAVDSLLKADGIKGVAYGLVPKDLDGGHVYTGR